MSLRNKLKSVAAAGVLAVVPACANFQPGGPLPTLVQPDGSYKTVPLEKDKIVLKVIQTGVKSLGEFPSIKEGLDSNLNLMEQMARQACTTGKKPDILLYHEFPLTGYSSGTRTQKLPFTVQIPGPETERLGKVARDCDTYLVFGAYAVDPDWPRHILSLNTVIGRDGEVAKVFWKSRNIKRVFEGIELTTTTVENVRDRYRELYGPEEEFPVLRTEFGNISVSTVQWDPFIFAAFAMRGTEIMLRTATLFRELDVTSTARTNDFYSAMANIAFPPGGEYEAGGSIIVSANGDILAKEARGYANSVIEAEIPIAEFRKDRKIPHYALDVVRPVFDQYVQEVPLNHMSMPTDELPETGVEMKAYIDRISRYKTTED